MKKKLLEEMFVEVEEEFLKIRHTSKKPVGISALHVVGQHLTELKNEAKFACEELQHHLRQKLKEHKPLQTTMEFPSNTIPCRKRRRPRHEQNGNRRFEF
jgi:hypothetical protein